MRSESETGIGGGALASDTWLSTGHGRVLAKPLKLAGPLTPESVGARIRSACAGRTCGEIAGATGYCAESVRRYRKGDPPPAGFILRLARATQISVDWLLIGRGPRMRCDLCDSELERMPLGRVLAELAQREEREADRKNSAATRLQN